MRCRCGVAGNEKHRKTAGKQNTGNTGEQEVESDNKTEEDITAKLNRQIDKILTKDWT